MKTLTKSKTRKIAIDLGIVAAVALFFVAGVFFESRRSGDRARDLAPDAGAVSVTDSVAEPTSSPEADSSDEPGDPAATEAPSSPAPTISVPAGTPDPQAVGQPVFLELAGIENESVIEASVVTVSGTTTPDALLSIDGQGVPVELDGSFAIELALEPGPNFIEFVASNLRGQETSRVISVVSIQ